MERVWLCVEAVFKHFTCCRKTKFAKQTMEGLAQVKGELDVYKYLKRARMTDNILRMLTTSNDRRFYKYAAESQYLVKDPNTI